MREARYEKDRSVLQLSKSSGVTERHIHKMENQSSSYVQSEGNTAHLAEALRWPVGLLLWERAVARTVEALRCQR